MKVWIVNHYAIPPRYGGLNRHYYFARYFTSKGIDVKILTSSKIHNTEYNFRDGDKLYFDKEIDGVTYTYIKSSDYSGNGISRIFSFLEFPVRAVKSIKSLVKKEGNPDIFYVSSPDIFTAFVVERYAKKRNIPVVVEIRDIWPESIVAYYKMSRRNPIIWLLYKLERWIYKNATKIVSTMEGFKNYIKDMGWHDVIPDEKIEYVNNGVDLEVFKNAEKGKLKDNKLQDENTFKVIYTGSIRKVNKISLLVDVASEIKSRGFADIAFLIYGDGTERLALIERCKEEGLDNIFFFGRVEKKYIPAILKSADLNIMLAENNGIARYGISWNKLFDYLASGKPILSNVVCGYDNIKKYKCGYVVNSGDIKEIADKIIEIKNMSIEEYREISDNALKVAERFDYNVLGEKMLGVLESSRG